MNDLAMDAAAQSPPGISGRNQFHTLKVVEKKTCPSQVADAERFQCSIPLPPTLGRGIPSHLRFCPCFTPRPSSRVETSKHRRCCPKATTDSWDSRRATAFARFMRPWCCSDARDLTSVSGHGEL